MDGDRDVSIEAFTCKHGQFTVIEAKMASWKHRVSFGIGRISAKSSDSYRLYAQNSEQIMDEKNEEFYTTKIFES